MKNLKKILGIFLIITLLLSFTIPFNKKSVNAATLKLNETKITLSAGKSINLKVSGTDKTVKWSTSEKMVAVVSQKGKVTGKNAGTVIITAKVGNFEAKCTVTVDAPLISIVTEKDALSLIKNQTAKIAYKLNPELLLKQL